MSELRDLNGDSIYEKQGALNRTHHRVLICSARDLQEVDSSLRNHPQLLDAVRQSRLGLVVDTVKLDADGEPLRRRSTRGPDDISHDLGRFLRAPAVCIGPEVRLGAEELGQQVPVGRMQLDAVEARVGAELGCPRELGYYLLDVGDAHLARRAHDEGRRQLGQQVRAEVKRHGRRRHILDEEALRTRPDGGLAPRVVELHDRRRRARGALDGLCPCPP